MQRNICRPGMIVCATAGRDAGRFFLVVGTEGTMLLLADGKTRSLAKPKRKNPFHVRATAQVLDPAPQTDRALRSALKPLNDPVSVPQTKMNQIRKEVIDDVEAGCN